MSKGKTSKLPDEEIIKYVQRFGPLTNRAIADHFGMGLEGMLKRLRRIKKVSSLRELKGPGKPIVWLYVGEEDGK